MSDLSVNSILDASGGATTTINGFTPTVSNMAGRNKIINGGMGIDQRNAGAAVTVDGSSNYYDVDRFSGFGESSDGVFTLQQSSTVPEGFNNSLLATVTTADASIGATQRYMIRHHVEGFNWSDMDYGLATAKTATVSFWVRSSVTGTFGGSFQNADIDRVYTFSYAISVANTWEKKTITIVGDTGGTWDKTTGIGFSIVWSLGAGTDRLAATGSWLTPAAPTFGATGQVNLISTLSATWQVTGVQLEEGSVATPFEHRMYGQELALCQRYYQESGSVVTTTGAYLNHLRLPVQMRAAPAVGTIIFDSGSGADFANMALPTGLLNLYQNTNYSTIATATKIPLSAEL